MDLTLAREALKRYFGYSSFRPLQSQIIQAVFDKSDALVLMPTGGGKSICYQIPAITLPGTCVVVSPLISLMKDQVEGLRANGVKAAFLNSSLSKQEQRVVEDDFYNQAIDLLYVSPEKLVSSGFLPLLQKAKVNLFAIDEAHCISAWGHDFRKEYTKMKFLKKTFPNIPILALTATADKLTRRDIVDQLQLHKPQKFIASFDRPNLSLEVRPGQKRFEQILAFIQNRPRTSGIIYCLSRKSVEDLAEKLSRTGLKARPYHAGMSDLDRSETQEAFINDSVPIICATIAFGMGIDKSNVRWVIHYNLPKNIESYYQEIGRAGRDGAKADTLLFYSYGDVLILQDMLEKGNGEQSEIQLAKLDRIRQYAESLACRRRILLNYFSENLQENCGNCDICKNPPKYFDGTVIAQKALSAVYRLRQQVGMGLLIDVLRGSGRKEIFEKGYNQIKTYGAGRDLPTSEWQHFILQLVNLGYLEIAHDQKGKLRLTPASKSVLFDKEPVQLVRIATVKERQEKEKANLKAKPKTARVRDELFEVLRQLRRKLAQERGVPPYIIFSDATLEEMAARKPLNDKELQAISGIGERKLHLYGDAFLQAIIEFIGKKNNTTRGNTQQVTLELFKQGLDLEAISMKRKLSLSTIEGHIAQLIEAGEQLDTNRLITEQEIEKIAKALKYLSEPIQLKAIYEYFDEQMPYSKIKIGLALLNQ
jgi:ATP-dependent DNA helicase RecQ